MDAAAIIEVNNDWNRQLYQASVDAICKDSALERFLNVILEKVYGFSKACEDSIENYLVRQADLLSIEPTRDIAQYKASRIISSLETLGSDVPKEVRTLAHLATKDLLGFYQTLIRCETKDFKEAVRKHYPTIEDFNQVFENYRKFTENYAELEFESEDPPWVPFKEHFAKMEQIGREAMIAKWDELAAELYK